VQFMCEGQPSRPANILEIVAINQGKSPLTMGEPTAPALSPQEFSALVDGGHVVVDGRDSAAFGGGHVPGALNIKVASPEFEQRLGWVVPLDKPILLVLDRDAALRTALRKLAFLGLDSRVEGFLAGGLGAWTAAGMPQSTLRQISVTELQQELCNGGDMRVLDVREDDEFTERQLDELQAPRGAPAGHRCRHRRARRVGMRRRRAFEHRGQHPAAPWLHAGPQRRRRHECLVRGEAADGYRLRRLDACRCSRRLGRTVGVWIESLAETAYDDAVGMVETAFDLFPEDVVPDQQVRLVESRQGP